MGFWFFLSVAMAGHFMLKAYKLRMFARNNKSDDRVARLEQEIILLKKQNLPNHAKRLENLEEAVYFGDFELRRQFQKLESEVADQKQRL